MPYIQKSHRTQFTKVLKELPPIPSKGELEYCIFYLMKHYMSDKLTRYATLHDCVYASMHCSEEFRRRYLDKREDVAMIQNGDI